MAANARFPPIADARLRWHAVDMCASFTAPEARQELFLRLYELLSDTAELPNLVQFLNDDLAYDPSNRSIIGPVLRSSEFETWRRLMVEAKHPDPSPARLRELSSELLSQMQAS